jgi:outer membrane protein assembly factor BamA
MLLLFLRFAHRVLPMLLMTGAAGAANISSDVLPDPVQLQSSGATIGDILINPQNIFDVSDPKEDKALFRVANKLHIKTRDRVIEQQLLFHSGDIYSQRALEESERILRSARYLYDASIRPVAYPDGRVDIEVITRDVWTLNPGLSFGRRGGKSTFGFEIEELNILGSGTSISASHKSGVDRDSDILEYKNPHLGGSWVALDARYANNSDGSTRGLTVERPFYSLDTPWAVGLEGLDDDRVVSLYDRGKVIDKFRDRQRTVTAYGGWSKGLVNGWTQRWTTGVSYSDDQFADEPGWLPPGPIPQDRTLVYPWIGFELLQNNFEKLHNRDQIGRTEDFYLGAHVSGRLGWADPSFGADRSAMVFSAAGGYGLRAGDRTTILFDSTASGRLEDGSLRNTTVGGQIRYYLQQSDRRLLFATIDAATSRNLDLDTQILLGGDNGLRGYPLRYQAGESRALFTVEQRYFTDWYPFRLFRIGAAAFFDMGRTWGEPPAGAPSLGLLKDAGVGLRIGSSRSGLGNVIHVDVAFPLDGDSSISSMQFLVETKKKF